MSHAHPRNQNLCNKDDWKQDRKYDHSHKQHHKYDHDNKYDHPHKQHHQYQNKYPQQTRRYSKDYNPSSGSYGNRDNRNNCCYTCPQVSCPRIEIPPIQCPRIECPRIECPRIEIPRIECPRIECPRIEIPRIECPRVECPRIEIPRIECPRIECKPCQPCQPCQSYQPSCYGDRDRNQYAYSDRSNKSRNPITYHRYPQSDSHSHQNLRKRSYVPKTNC